MGLWVLARAGLNALGKMNVPFFYLKSNHDFPFIQIFARNDLCLEGYWFESPYSDLPVSLRHSVRFPLFFLDKRLWAKIGHVSVILLFTSSVVIRATCCSTLRNVSRKALFYSIQGIGWLFTKPFISSPQRSLESHTVKPVRKRDVFSAKRVYLQ